MTARVPARLIATFVKSIVPAELRQYSFVFLTAIENLSFTMNGSGIKKKLVPWGTDGRLPLSGDFRSLIVE